MGFSVYKVERYLNDVNLGSFNLYVPQFETMVQDLHSNGYGSFAQLLVDIGEENYVSEAQYFVGSSEIASMFSNWGYHLVVDLSQYAGEKWVLESGRHILIYPDGRGMTFYLTLEEDPAQSPVINLAFSTSGDFKYAFTLPADTIIPGDTGTRVAVAWIDSSRDRTGFVNSSYPRNGIPEYSSSFFELDTPILTTDDPYEQGGSSGTGGGMGTFSGTGDEIAIPSLPTLSAVDAGFITLFNPSITQLGALASYMWSDLFDVDGWRKIFADPMNAILGLSIVPVNVPSGNTKTVKVGNISTGVSMNVASSQYVEVDCGTLNVKEFWGAYLDYDPYTKAEIYLPYIGTHALAVDDIMGKSVHVVYHVDVLSGACCAYVQCGGTVLYTFIGQCSSSIPITGDNWTNVINGAISIAGSIGSMVATGGVSAPMEIGNIASTAVNTMKPSVEKSGAMGGTGGMMGVQTPYLILTRPRQALPSRQNTFTGYPSFITEKLETLSGYTEVFKIHLENVSATEQELSEIETLLKTGVIF